MSSLLNPSFEDPGPLPGEAAGWTLTAVTRLEVIAGFGPAPERAQEDFEGWAPPLASLADVSVALAFFDGLLEGHEAFERGWGNEIYASDFSEAVFVELPFGDDGPESFEAGWLTEPYATSFEQIAASAGVFDDAPVEDFENQWQSNQAYAWTFAAAGAIAGRFGAAAQSSEDFEGEWAYVQSL